MRRPLFVLSAFKMAFVWREMGICRKHHSGIVHGGDSFSPRFCSILRPRPKSHACSSTSDCAANIPLSFRCTRALLSLSVRLFSPPLLPFFPPLILFLSVFLSSRGGSEGCQGGRVALGNRSWRRTRVARRLPAMEEMGNPAVPPPFTPPPPPPPLPPLYTSILRPHLW